jgi:hypothetical protein
MTASTPPKRPRNEYRQFHPRNHRARPGFDGLDLPGATQPTLTLTDVQPGNEGFYTVVVSNRAGSVTSDPPARLTVAYPPALVQQPRDQTVTGGTPLVLTVVASGTAPLSYQWRFQGTNLVEDGRITGVQTPTLNRGSMP